MLQVLTPEQVIESREKLLDDLEEALIGDPDEWRGDFPENFELYNMLHHIFEFWKAQPRTRECFCCGHGGQDPHACG